MYKGYTECVTHENYYSDSPAQPSPLYTGLPRPPPPPSSRKKNQIWFLYLNSLIREPKIRAVGFVLEKLLTYFELLIVPRALHCVNFCICILTHLTFWHTVLVSAPPHPLQKIRFRFYVKINLLESSKLKLESVCL